MNERFYDFTYFQLMLNYIISNFKICSMAMKNDEKNDACAVARQIVRAVCSDLVHVMPQ